MKKLLFACLLFAACNCQAQIIFKDSVMASPILESKQNTTTQPMYLNRVLFETIVVYQDGKMIYSGYEKIKTCAEYREFKKKYPAFILMKQDLLRFKKCSQIATTSHN